MREYLYLLATDKKKGSVAGIFKCLLFILSLIYGMSVRILSFIYGIKPYRLNCKVISIGNITLGGTGKTSLVELLALKLKERGCNTAVLSRGYKRKSIHYPLSAVRYETMGDEPFMLSKNLCDIPVIVDKDRIRAAKKAIRDYGTDAVILDDGFQQWRISKDLEIVTIDATNPFGNLRLLPRGILREPLSSLKRADIFVLAKVNLRPANQGIEEILKKVNPGALIVEAIHSPLGFYRIGDSRDNLLGPGEFKGKKASLVCGIADPRSFE
ncbi:MAG: tetraacyldisaccharide 4'-kinase, partial [Candidatus Omnitrophota bacterium]